ncbi:cytosine/adenosine deaminase [Ichthyobacterium seriolicida]|uniref:tRNA-specific adenosine deaminase n=1 Tax=Ichthyobacterium seriolicida TaxID=242600 RepID=A0A1J1EAX6_9FLAO|nr:cytosine/adenosine deaminase [Ichthyobacterium seriolicida]
MNILTDEYFMGIAIQEAKKALYRDEVPVGAVVVLDNNIIARGRNMTEMLNDVTAHAEIQAITSAANSIGSKYLTDCIIYTTLEPCLMCAGALYLSKIKKLIYSARDKQRGYHSKYNIQLHPNTEVEHGIFEEISEKIITDFFKNKRV